MVPYLEVLIHRSSKGHAKTTPLMATHHIIRNLVVALQDQYVQVSPQSICREQLSPTPLEQNHALEEPICEFELLPLHLPFLRQSLFVSLYRRRAKAKLQGNDGASTIFLAALDQLWSSTHQ
jgi:hypothetical protein